MSATDQIKFTDGRLHETEIFGQAHTRFPFKDNSPSDHHARVHTRKFWCDPRRFVPKVYTRTAFTNLLTSSDAFDTAVWTNQAQFTRTADNAANPWDGSTTVDKLLETVTNAAHLTGRPYTFTAASAHCHWAILAPINGRRYWRLRSNDGTTNFDAIFDLTASKVKSTAGSGAAAGILKLEDGYFLIWLTFTPLAAVGSIALNASNDGTFASYAGDTTKGCYLAQMQLELASTPGPLIVTTGAPRSVLAPDRDPDDIFAYLVTETDQGEYAGGLSAVQREFARIPRRQYTFPGAKYIGKPDYTPGSAFNPFDLTNGALAKGAGVNFPDQGTLGSASYSAANGLYTSGDGHVYGNIKLPAAQLVGYATAGTFTLTRGADTTGSLNWNDSAATICAALNALSDVIAKGLTFSPYGGTNFLAATTGGWLAVNVTGGAEADRQVPVMMNAGSLTVTGTSAHPTTTVINSTTHAIYLPIHLTITSHALDTSLALAVVWGSSSPITHVLPSGYWGSYSSNVVWVAPYLDPSKPASMVGTYVSTYVLSAESSYVGGSRLPGRRSYTDYYLLGVSPDVDVPTDIDSPLGMQNPSTFLTALLTPLAGYQDYESVGATPWLGSIYGRQVDQIDFDAMG
jgi:hypothetical protein